MRFGIFGENALDKGGNLVREEKEFRGRLADFGGEVIEAEFIGTFGHGGEHAADFE